MNKIIKSTLDSKSFLVPISRLDMRKSININNLELFPFFGFDIWNAYEFSWINSQGKPQIAILTLIIPANSINTIESKSLKYYLYSYSHKQFNSVNILKKNIKNDISSICKSTIKLKLQLINNINISIREFNGISIDSLSIKTNIYFPEKNFLYTSKKKIQVKEVLYSNLLKSNCPVTGQPDFGSIQINYIGKKINYHGLLKYIISYRNYSGFHEKCTENIFLDIMDMCNPSKLSIYTRYTRRGGIDINTFRTNYDHSIPNNIRLTRQ